MPPEQNTANSQQATTPKPKKKLSGFPFVAMLILAIIKDIIDIGVDLTVILFFLSFILTPLYYAILYAYFYLNGVKIETRKAATMAITFVVGFIPYLNLLPETTFNLLMIRFIENNPTLSKLTKLTPKPKI